MKIKILLADDHKIMREGLKSLVEKQPDMEVVGEAGDGLSALQIARQIKPDIVIMDVAMPNLNGIAATQRIKSEFGNTKIIALSMHSDQRFVIEMLRAGASGYLLKQSAFEELISAIKTVIKDKIFVSSNILDVIVKNCINKSSETDYLVQSLLTGRERQILQLIAEENSTKEISYLLNVSVKTVETHRLNIMNKLDIHNLAGLIKFAIREGLTSLES